MNRVMRLETCGNLLKLMLLAKSDRLMAMYHTRYVALMKGGTDCGKEGLL